MDETSFIPSNADSSIDETIDQTNSLNGYEMKRIEEDINACEAIDVLRDKCFTCLLTTIKNEDVVQRTCSQTAFLYYILFCYRKKMEKKIIEENLASTRNNIIQILRRKMMEENLSEKQFALFLLKSRRGEKLAHLVNILGTSIFLRSIPWPKIYKMKNKLFSRLLKALAMAFPPEQNEFVADDNEWGNDTAAFESFSNTSEC
jgi:hypothetical protein